MTYNTGVIQEQSLPKTPVVRRLICIDRVEKDSLGEILYMRMLEDHTVGINRRMYRRQVALRCPILVTSPSTITKDQFDMMWMFADKYV